jgi:hypothetical protein
MTSALQGLIGRKGQNRRWAVGGPADSFPPGIVFRPIMAQALKPARGSIRSPVNPVLLPIPRWAGGLLAASWA